MWQSVWIEETGRAYIRSCRITPEFREGMLRFSFRIAGSSAGSPPGRRQVELELEAAIRDEGGGQYRFEVHAPGQGEARKLVSFEELDLRLWSPDDPVLYAVRYTLRDPEGGILDEVDSYFGVREITWSRDGLSINAQPTYLRFVLVQGYYPGGVYTPKHYAIMEQDIRRALDSGYNGIRIHQKIEDPYFQFLCDRHGLLTTCEIPSFYRYGREVGRQFLQELREVWERDGQHPSCIFWVLFNESWGMHEMFFERSRARAFLLEMVAAVKELDGTRPVIDNSGWEHVRTDIVDIHHYLRSAERARAFYRKLEDRDHRTLHSFSLLGVKLFYLLKLIGHKTRTVFLTGDGHADAPWLVTEYGGFGWYRVSSDKSQLELIEQYTRDIVECELFRGYCYTQLYDVEAETNGLFTFQRIPKLPMEALRGINEMAAGGQRSGRARRDGDRRAGGPGENR